MDVSCLTRHGTRTDRQCSNLRFALALNEPLRNNKILLVSLSKIHSSSGILGFDQIALNFQFQFSKRNDVLLSFFLLYSIQDSVIHCRITVTKNINNYYTLQD